MTEARHWKTVLLAQGRSLKWLAEATGTPRRTVYDYSSKTPTRASAEFLAKASKALAEEVSG